MPSPSSTQLRKGVGAVGGGWRRLAACAGALLAAPSPAAGARCWRRMPSAARRLPVPPPAAWPCSGASSPAPTPPTANPPPTLCFHPFPHLPEKQPSASRAPGVGTSAGGRCCQCTRSELTAWPHTCGGRGAAGGRAQQGALQRSQHHGVPQPAVAGGAAASRRSCAQRAATGRSRQAVAHDAKGPLAGVGQVLVEHVVAPLVVQGACSGWGSAGAVGRSWAAQAVAKQRARGWWAGAWLPPRCPAGRAGRHGARCAARMLREPKESRQKAGRQQAGQQAQPRTVGVVHPALGRVHVEAGAVWVSHHQLRMGEGFGRQEGRMCQPGEAATCSGLSRRPAR